MSKIERKFWMLVCVEPCGKHTICKTDGQAWRYLDHDEAERTAERLARGFPGNRYVILEAMYDCQKSDVAWTHYTEETQEMPF